jgi:hypothetical protein
LREEDYFDWLPTEDYTAHVCVLLIVNAVGCLFVLDSA